MFLILKCVSNYEIDYLDSFQYLTCEINDIVICDSYIHLNDEIFGFGKNYKTNNYGLFLVKKFIIIERPNYVNKDLYSVIYKNQAPIPINEQKATPNIYHRIVKKSVGYLSLCIICGEYVMSLKLNSIHCTVCNQVFHDICYDNHKSYKTCHRFLKTTNQECIASLKPTEMSLTEWSNEQILQWLCSENFFRLIDLFEMKKFTGSDLLDIMSKDETEILITNNNNNNIKFWSSIDDVFYRESLYIGLSVLMGKYDSGNSECHTNEDFNYFSSQSSTENEASNGELHVIEFANHKFRDASFTSKIFCYYCGKILLGLQRQGYHCVKCLKNFHKMCAFQYNVTWCTENLISNDVDIYNSSIFGVSLQEQAKDSNGIPIFIKICIEELERRYGQSNNFNELLGCYRQTANTEDTDELKRIFSHPKYDNQNTIIGISELSEVSIAKLIKLYFKELPEPLLPYGFYYSLIDCVRKENDDKVSCHRIHTILTHLPSPNKEILQFLMKHFDFICSNNFKNVKKHSIPWSCIFSKTLIWPSKVMVNEFPVLKSRHQRLIQLIFENRLLSSDKFTWTENNSVSDCDDGQALSASLDKYQLQNIKTNVEIIDQDITSQDWYWSDTSKEEVNEFMAGLQDGYFMVRDSSDKSQGGLYTLTIRKDGENKLIRIIQRNGLYGFQEPCHFESVAHLIRHYQKNKLSEYNEQLNITLRFPCSKTKSEIHGNHDFYRLDNVELINELYMTMKDYSETNMKVDKDTEIYENYQKELDEVTKCLKGIDRIINWCTNHTTHIMNTMQPNNMREHSQKCLLQLNNKLKDCDKVVIEMNARRELLVSKSTQLLSELSVTRPNLKRLNRQQSSYIRLLKDRGVPDELFSSDGVDNLDKLCEDIRHALNENNPINNRSNWFIENISREEADMKLSGRPHGTFLIRRSKEPNKYALDIMVEKNVQHCRILCIDGRYGFIENECLYQSLDDLVKTFQLVSLTRYNSILTAKLIYPVNSSVL